MFHYSCGVADVTSLGGTLRFSPSSSGYCIFYSAQYSIVCEEQFKTEFCILSAQSQAYCSAGWPLSFNVVTSLHIYVWFDSSVHLFTKEFSWSLPLVHLHNPTLPVVHSHIIYLLTYTVPHCIWWFFDFLTSCSQSCFHTNLLRDSN